MASVRCPRCGDEIVPLPIEPETDEAAPQYLCPSCREPLTVGVVDEYLGLEEEEVSG